MDTVFKVFLVVVIFLIILAAWTFLIAWAVMALWNWLMPVIFKLPTIDFWQAWGISILAGILFQAPRYTKSKGE